MNDCWKATALLLILLVGMHANSCTQRVIDNEVSDLILTLASHQKMISIQDTINDEAETACTAHSDDSLTASAIVDTCQSMGVVVEAEDAEEGEEGI